MNSVIPSYEFNVEFFDERAELVRALLLTFYTQKSEIELFDIRNCCPFLKRTDAHTLSLINGLSSSVSCSHSDETRIHDPSSRLQSKPPPSLVLDDSNRFGTRKGESLALPRLAQRTKEG
jgi:hypothetical protein